MIIITSAEERDEGARANRIWCMETFENNNEGFKALTVHFGQKEIDYDHSIN